MQAGKEKEAVEAMQKVERHAHGGHRRLVQTVWTYSSVCVRVWFWCPLKFIHKAVSDAHKEKVRVHSSVIVLQTCPS